MKLLAKFVLILFPVWAQAQIVLDGNISVSDLGYYRQLTAANGNNGFNTGNDLGALYYFSTADTLYIGITGTVENNSHNNIVFFIDNVSYAGRGTGTLGGGSGGVGVFAYPATCLGSSKLDAGFDVDYAFALNKGGGITNMFLDAMRFGTNAGDEYFQYGNVGSCPLDGTMVTQIVPFCDTRGSCTPSESIRYAFLDGFLPSPSPAQFNGFEFAIPYAALPTFSVGHHLRFFVLITNQNGYGSNECMPGNPVGNLECNFDLSVEHDDISNDIFYTYPDVILPLSFLANTAKWNNGQAMLQWTVAQDFEAMQYTIERSANGTSFATIGTVTAQQAKDFASYSFTDNNPLRGKNFYRIKAIRRNGEPKYSQQATLENTGGSFCIYPNPASGEVTLYGPNLPKGVYPVLISNITGQVVHRSAVYHSSGSLRTTLSLPSLPAGIYSLQLGNDRQLPAQRLVIE